MNQTTTKAPDDTNLLVTITVEQFRDLMRREFQTALGQRIEDDSAKPEKLYLGVKDAAALSGLAPSTIRLYIRQGKIPTQRVGRRILIKQIDLVTFLNSNRSEILLDMT